MIYELNSGKDINKFYKKLSFLIKFRKSKKLKLKIGKNINKINTDELKSIEKAFNIKDKDKRLKFVFEEICNYIDTFYVNRNFCEFKNGKCVCQREKRAKTFTNGCCGTCEYLGIDGCTIKSLACKIFFCHYIKKKKKVFKLRDIKIAKYYFTPTQYIIANYNFFKTEEENLELLRKNSLLKFAFSKEKKVKRF